MKLSGMTPLKLLYPTIVRMRREYKSQLEVSFNKKIYDKIDPSFMHSKYYEKIVPSSFHAGITSKVLERNKHHFQRYVLHKNSKYEISSIEEHKMNEKEPFSLVMYNDGNCQLLNQLELEIFTMQKQATIMEEVLFFQAYIKYKSGGEGILYSEYSYDHNQVDIDLEVDRRAELDVMMLLGGLGKYDEGYRDVETIEEMDYELMVS